MRGFGGVFFVCFVLKFCFFYHSLNKIHSNSEQLLKSAQEYGRPQAKC